MTEDCDIGYIEHAQIIDYLQRRADKDRKYGLERIERFDGDESRGEPWLRDARAMDRIIGFMQKELRVCEDPAIALERQLARNRAEGAYK